MTSELRTERFFLVGYDEKGTRYNSNSIPNWRTDEGKWCKLFANEGGNTGI